MWEEHPYNRRGLGYGDAGRSVPADCKERLTVRLRTRLIFYVVVLLLWLGIAALGLEALAAIRFSGMKRDYAELKEVLIRRAREVAPRTAVEDPQGSAAEDAGALGFDWGGVLARLDDEGRERFCTVHEVQLIAFSPGGRMERAWGTKNGGVGFPAAVRAKALEAFVRRDGKASIPPIPFEAAGTHYELALFDAGGEPLGAVRRRWWLRPAAVPETVADSSLWEVPYFRFRPKTVSGAIVTNGHGFRDDEVVLPKPPGRYRIACIGGSTTVEGASNAQSYPNLLEARLGEAMGNGRVDVLNCGVHGVDTLKEKWRLADYLSLAPDLVMTYDGQNEIQYALCNRWDGEMADWRKGLLKSRFLQWAFNWALLPGKGEIGRQFDAYSFAHVRQMHALLDSLGVEMVLCSFAYPDMRRCTARELAFFEWSVREFWPEYPVGFRSYCRIIEIYNRKTRALCEELDMHYIPVAEELAGTTDYFVDICHFSQAGIDAMAGIVARHTERLVKKGRTS